MIPTSLLKFENDSQHTSPDHVQDLYETQWLNCYLLICLTPSQTVNASEVILNL